VSSPASSNDVLATARLSLWRPTAADVDAIFLIHNDQRAWAHNPSDALATRDEADQLFQRWDAHWRRHGFGYWVVRRQGSDTPIGFCGIKIMWFRGSEVANMFYRFDPAVWGCGMATEAATAVVAWAADKIPERQLVARIRPQNLASQRVAIRAGLVRAEDLDSPGEDRFDLAFVRIRRLTDC